MSPGLALPSERFWDVLLTKIEEGRVIPVIGPELVQMTSLQTVEPLETLIARRLADETGISQQGDDGKVSLHDVVARAHRADPQEDYHAAVHRILKSIEPLTPAPLRALARITDFKLYVTLTFDSSVSRALDEERDLVSSAHRHIGYAPNLRRVDLPSPIAQLDEPYVYALFGKSCSAPEFVISDEDVIEWVTALQDPDNRPVNLFDALRTHHILFLGCALPDWLLRLFLRMTREGRVSATRPSETLIDSAIPDQQRLVAFLDHFSPKTTILDTDPASFAQELEQRWQRRKEQTPRALSQNRPADLKAGGVFLSYASENIEAARTLHASLSGRQIDTWFDASRLQSGASYDKIIERNIGLCGLFIILLSKTTQERLVHWQVTENSSPETKPYFLAEWELALARERLFEGSIEIWPLTLDHTDPSSAVFPAGLRKRTWEPAPGEAQIEQFTTRAKQVVRDHRKKGLSSP
jgi:hypothetical protein